MPKHDYHTKRLPEIITQDQADRFWSYVEIRDKDECWWWIGSLNAYGYGQFGLDSKRRSVRCPRLAFRLYYGGDPWPRDILHSCDVKVGKASRKCCNPHHMRLGTRRDNNEDRDKKGRTASGDVLRRSDITAMEIPSIIRRRNAGETLQSIADTYGVDSANIGDIFRGMTWSKITGFPLVKPGRSKRLSPEKARSIHILRRSGKILREIATIMNVSISSVQKVLDGSTYRKIWNRFNRKRKT